MALTSCRVPALTGNPLKIEACHVDVGDLTHALVMYSVRDIIAQCFLLIASCGGMWENAVCSVITGQG